MGQLPQRFQTFVRRRARGETQRAQAGKLRQRTQAFIEQGTVRKVQRAEVRDLRQRFKPPFANDRVTQSQVFKLRETAEAPERSVGHRCAAKVQRRQFRECTEQVEIIRRSRPQDDLGYRCEVLVPQEQSEPAVDHSRRFTFIRGRTIVSNAPAELDYFCCSQLLPVLTMQLSGDESEDNAKRGDEHQQRLQTKAGHQAERSAVQRATRVGIKAERDPRVDVQNLLIATYLKLDVRLLDRDTRASHAQAQYHALRLSGGIQSHAAELAGEADVRFLLDDRAADVPPAPVTRFAPPWCSGDDACHARFVPSEDTDFRKPVNHLEGRRSPRWGQHRCNRTLHFEFENAQRTRRCLVQLPSRSNADRNNFPFCSCRNRQRRRPGRVATAWT